MVGYRVFGILVIVVIGISSEHLTGEQNGLTYQNQHVSREDVKAYLQPILYQKLLQQHGDSAVIQQTKTVVSEYLVESLLDSAQRPAEPVRSEEFARQNSNGTTAGVTTRRPLIGNLTRPSEAHVIGQVDQIIQNVNVGNITGIVDQALRIRAPAPVQQLVNSIMNLVLCNPFNRLWNRCYGGGGIFDGRRR